MSSYELDRAVALTAAGDGRYELTMTGDWNTPNETANGGYVAAIVVRAALDHAQATNSSQHDPLAAAITYLKPPRPVLTEVAVRVIRQGRRVSSYEITMTQEGTTVTQATVSLHDADSAGHVQHTPHVAPVLPPRMSAPTLLPTYFRLASFPLRTATKCDRLLRPGGSTDHRPARPKRRCGSAHRTAAPSTPSPPERSSMPTRR